MARQSDPMGLIPSFTFWGDGCAELARNASEALRHAGLPVTTANLVRFASSLPGSTDDLLNTEWQRTSFCNECLKAAYDLNPRREADEGMRRVFDYFLARFINLPSNAQQMLAEAFVAFIGNIELGVERTQYQRPDDMILSHGTEGSDENKEKVSKSSNLNRPSGREGGGHEPTPGE